MSLDTIRLDLLVAILDHNTDLARHLFDAWVAIIHVQAIDDTAGAA